MKTLGTLETIGIIKVSLVFKMDREAKEAKCKILDSALKMFMRVGIRSVTMDDVAREMSMSKKTLYQYFTNKNELVKEATANHLDEDKKMFTELKESSENAIDEISRIAFCIRESMSKVNPSTLYDLKKYHAEVWGIFRKYKDEFVVNHIQENLQRGKQEGFYRKEINEGILARLRMKQVESIFEEDAFPRGQYDFADVQIQVFDHFIHGLLTEKGKKLYDTYQDKHNQTTN